MNGGRSIEAQSSTEPDSFYMTDELYYCLASLSKRDMTPSGNTVQKEIQRQGVYCAKQRRIPNTAQSQLSWSTLLKKQRNSDEVPRTTTLRLKFDTIVVLVFQLLWLSIIPNISRLAVPI